MLLIKTSEKLLKRLMLYLLLKGFKTKEYKIQKKIIFKIKIKKKDLVKMSV
jgi:hypothetical protein